MAPASMASWVTLSSRSPPVVMKTVRLLTSSVLNGDVGLPSALAAAPQAASPSALPVCVQAEPSALR